MLTPILRPILQPVLVPVDYEYGDVFNPMSIFAGGEQGFWYDPSDFSTLFQDAAGTTPVTEVGQPVGLVLDKSKGLVLGPELVGTYDFTSGWGNSNSTTDSASSFTVTTSPGGIYSSTNPLTIGKAYRFVVSWSATTSVTFEIRNGTSGSDTLIGTQTGSSGTMTFILPNATKANMYFRVVGLSTVTVSAISVRELPGNHAYQTTALSRPTLQQDSTGRYYLSFDGTDDGMATPSIDFTGTDKMTLWAGVRKLSDADRAVVCELSADVTVNAGTFHLRAPQVAGDSFSYLSEGTVFSIAQASGFPSPITAVLTGIGAISTDTCILRVNGAQAASNTTNQGTGNYGNYPLYIGRRGGTTLPFNGRIYQLIGRGAETPLAQIVAMEQYVNSKTGAY